ncbi:MAG: glutathione S-transferase family protein [Burkholderiales bacterium]|nr:glutathione S-transferase family protein [Burkholderiales bacterium]MDE2453935.1 glutathione S-transferase family protein [Burkholderiales bacterium]
MTLKIHADPITVNCRKVLAGLKLIGAPYELVHVDYFKGEQKLEPYLSLNPNAALPAMTDGAFELWESNAILQYAADKVGNERAYPRELQARADVNRWMFWESASWFPSCYVFLVENCVKPLLGGQPDPAVLDAQLAQFHKLAGVLERRLAHQDWLVGQGPTIADIAVASAMHLHGWQKLPLGDHPHLVRWLTGRVEQLPCWQDTTVYEGFTTQRPA